MSSKNKELSSSSDVLQSLFQNSKSSLGEGYTRWKLWHQWKAVVGETMAKHSTPVGYKRGVLYVWVESSARMQEMSFLAGDIIYKVNQHLGRKWVRRVQFSLDRKNVPNLEEAPESLKAFLQK